MLLNSTTSLYMGEAQIYKQGYEITEDFYSTLDLSPSQEHELLQAGFHSTVRTQTSALLAVAEKSISAVVIGIDLDGERHVSDLHNHIKRGQWLDNTPSTLVLGHKISSRLGLELGEKLVLLGQAADGSIASTELTFVGSLYPVSQAIDSYGALIKLTDFRKIFFLDKGFHKLILKRKNSKGQYNVDLSQVKKIWPEASVKSWRELRKNLATVLDIYNLSVAIVIFIAIFSLCTLLFNTALMTVYDRSKEYGTFQAIGMKPSSIFMLVILERLFMGFLIVIFGLAVGIPISLAFKESGLDFSFLVNEIRALGNSLQPIIYTHLGLFEIVTPVAAFLAAIPISASAAAFQAAHINGLEAMKGGH